MKLFIYRANTRLHTAPGASVLIHFWCTEGGKKKKPPWFWEATLGDVAAGPVPEDLHHVGRIWGGRQINLRFYHRWEGRTGTGPQTFSLHFVGHRSWFLLPFFQSFYLWMAMLSPKGGAHSQPRKPDGQYWCLMRCSFFFLSDDPKPQDVALVGGARGPIPHGDRIRMEGQR